MCLYCNSLIFPALRHGKVIIVDTSGRHKQEDALFDEMKEIQEAVQPDNTTLIMDATQGQAVFDQAKAFHGKLRLHGRKLSRKEGGSKAGFFAVALCGWVPTK